MSDFATLCDICGASQSVPSYGDWRCVQCNQAYEYDEGYRISLTAAQWALLRNPPQWIPVTERLPEERAPVLTYGDDPVEGPFTLIGLRVPESKFGPADWHLPGFSDFGPVTHWMPLPAPPEVEPPA